MKKLYSFLAALALTTPAFAGTVFADNDMEGEWTFTVFDYTDGPSTTPVKLILTATDEFYEGHFALPDGMGYLYFGGYGTDADEPGLVYFRLDPEGQNKIGSDDFLSESQPYYIDWGDVMDSSIYCFYNPETKKVEKFKRYNSGLRKWYDLEQVGFKVKTYETRDNLLTSHDFVVQSIQRGVIEDNDNDPAIYISLPDDAITTGYTSATAANFTATPIVTADNVEEFELHYSVDLWGDFYYVEDAVVEAQDDVYTIFVDNLDYAGFGVNYYNLKVWAEAGEYKSAVVTKEIEIYEAPYLRVITSSPAEKITDTTAEIDVTIMADNIEGNLTYTISATSATGPAVEPVTGTSRTATLNITGLTPGTEYTYTVKGEANYDNKFTLEKTASVTFTTASAPAVTINGNASAQVDMTQNMNPDEPELAEPVEWTVTATFNELSNELVINDFYNQNSIKFNVNLSTGDAFAVNQGFEDEDYFEDFGLAYYGNKESQLTVTAKVMNYGENQTRVVVDPWGEMVYIGDGGFEWYFIAFYYNTDIILDGTIPGLQYNGPSVTIDNVRWIAQEDTPNGSVTDFYVTVATEDLDDDADITVYYKGPGSGDFQVAEKSGDEYTFTLSNLEGETEYTVTVYAASGVYTSDEVEVQFVTNTGVDNVIATPAAAVRYYNLQGIEVTHPAVGNAYIKVEGTKATKVVVK